MLEWTGGCLVSTAKELSSRTEPSMNRQRIWMIGTAPDGKGGIASVIQQYEAAGVFEGGLVHYEPSHNDRTTLGRVLPFLRCASRLWPSMLLGRVRLLHAHTSYAGSFWRKLILAIPAFALKVPVVVHLHAGSIGEFYTKGGVWRRYCLRQLLHRAFRVVVLSEEWLHWALSVEPRANVVVIPNSLAMSTGAGTLADELPSRPMVLFLGRVGDSKGTFDLLRALAGIKDKVVGVRLVIGGDGDIARLNTEIARLGMEAFVEHVGWADAAAKATLLSQCWVLALPSYKEGLPVGILEAMAFGKAVVSCPVGGVPHAVKHGVTGLLSTPGDVDGLAANLLAVLSSRKFARQLGRAGRLAFERSFCHEVNLPMIFSLYRNAGATVLPVIRGQRSSIG